MKIPTFRTGPIDKGPMLDFVDEENNLPARSRMIQARWKAYQVKLFKPCDLILVSCYLDQFKLVPHKEINETPCQTI